MSDGFLGRWSRRKLDRQQGKTPAAEPAQPLSPAPTQPESAGSERAPAVAARSEPAGADARIPASAGDAPVAVPPPTLEDVKSLSAESDFSRFTAREVAPEVKNAALKKLFSDPRYNVMDGLDVYTGDYSQPDPIPAQMVRQLAGATFLRLFEAQELTQEQSGANARDVADNATARSVSQSGTASAAVPKPTDHADADLRLQQDDAAAGPGSGPEPA